MSHIIDIRSAFDESQTEIFQQSIRRSLLSLGEVNDLESIIEWINKKRENTSVKIEQTTFSNMDQWSQDPIQGSYHHVSHGFFRIDGVNIQTNYGVLENWQQPIISQPEIGILGIITKQINSTLHFLMQAKIEPGNINYVQISPTLQATKSNYLQKHKGRAPQYLEYFLSPSKKIIVDQLQSEQGARFLKKRNRNIIIYVDEPIEILADFQWMTLAQIQTLMRIDNTINMDTRTVLSGFPLGDVQSLDRLDGLPTIQQEFLKSELSTESLYPNTQLLAWLTELKTMYDLFIDRIDLRKVNGWVFTDERIHHVSERFFDVLPIQVSIENREVRSWNQPMVKPKQVGVCCFFVKKIDDIYHFLVQAKMECGNFDILEIAPTIQCLTGSYKSGQVPFVPELEKALEEGTSVLIDTFQSEEGGRFYGEQNRHIIIDVGSSFSTELPPRFTWMTKAQLKHFIQYNNLINIQARSLLSLL